MVSWITGLCGRDASKRGNSLELFRNPPTTSFFQVLQIFRITKSDKIDPAGYCVAVSHDIDELDCLNHAAKSDILRVSIKRIADFVTFHYIVVQQLKEVGGNPRQHAALLKEGCEDESATVGKNTSSRSCLLIPVNCLNDDLIQKCCDGRIYI